MKLGVLNHVIVSGHLCMHLALQSLLERTVTDCHTRLKGLLKEGNCRQDGKGVVASLWFAEKVAQLLHEVEHITYLCQF